jgi:hypothetical protein
MLVVKLTAAVTNNTKLVLLISNIRENAPTIEAKTTSVFATEDRFIW